MRKLIPIPGRSLPSRPARRMCLMNRTRKGAVIGAAPALLGAAVSKNDTKGAVLGGAVGAVVGGIIGNTSTNRPRGLREVEGARSSARATS